MRACMTICSPIASSTKRVGPADTTVVITAVMTVEVRRASDPRIQPQTVNHHGRKFLFLQPAGSAAMWLTARAFHPLFCRASCILLSRHMPDKTGWKTILKPRFHTCYAVRPFQADVIRPGFPKFDRSA
jgi:hypothetical protein